MKGYINDNSSQTQMTISFSNNGSGYVGSTNLSMQFAGTSCTGNTSPISGEYRILYANMVIPEAYVGYNYIKIQMTDGGTAVGSKWSGFAEVNLLYPRDITTATGYTVYSGKPYIVPASPSANETVLMATNQVRSFLSANIFYNGSGAFYFTLPQNSFVEITISFIVYIPNGAGYPIIINMHIDSTITTNKTPNASIIYNFSETSARRTFPTISWSGYLTSGIHIISLSQYIPSSNYSNTYAVAFDSSSSIHISCIARY